MSKKTNVVEIEVEHTPGICIWCLKPFDSSKSNYFYGHEKCAEDNEAKCDREMLEELKARLPVGTRFDLAGGAACD